MVMLGIDLGLRLRLRLRFKAWSWSRLQLALGLGLGLGSESGLGLGLGLCLSFLLDQNTHGLPGMVELVPPKNLRVGRAIVRARSRRSQTQVGLQEGRYTRSVRGSSVIGEKPYN